jgi:hypothetical protein
MAKKKWDGTSPTPTPTPRLALGQFDLAATAL